MVGEMDQNEKMKEDIDSDQDVLQEVSIVEVHSIVDFDRLSELINSTDTGSSQLTRLVEHSECKQANVVRLLEEELEIFNKQREKVDLKIKKLEIVEDFQFEFEEGRDGGSKCPVSASDEIVEDVIVRNEREEVVEAGFETVAYWKQRAVHSEKLLDSSIQREQVLLSEKLQESTTDVLKRADCFLHFVLQNAPVVTGYQDKNLKYRFMYNQCPNSQEEDILGKTDGEIFTGAGVKECQDFKKEVLEKGLPAKREITFETELFGSKTFLMFVEPVFGRSGEIIGINYTGMDVTDQVRKREKMAKLREETELNKPIL